MENVKIALISDIHSNREALDAVFAHIDTQAVDKVYCLGDVVGYGSEPEYCVDRIRERCAESLMGNHDDGLFHGASDFNPHARGALDFTRKRMRPRWYSSRVVKKRWAWLQERPLTHKDGRFLLVHGSPRDPVREYVLSTDGFLNPGKLRSIFESFEGIAFAGHTHHGGVLDSGFKFHGLSGEAETTFKFEQDAKYFVNVGSVGQPRDGDSRACYAILESDSVTWHRITYDYRATQAKIRQHPGLSEILASRLAMGR